MTVYDTGIPRISRLFQCLCLIGQQKCTDLPRGILQGMNLDRKSVPVFLFFHPFDRSGFFADAAVKNLQYLSEQFLTAQRLHGEFHIKIPDFQITDLFHALIRSHRIIDQLDLFVRKPLSHLGRKDSHLNGFGHKVIHPLPDKHVFRSLQSICRKGYDRNIIILRVKTPDDMRRLHAIQFRHHMIHENDIILESGNLLDSILAADHRINLHFQRLQKSFHHSQIYGIVIHDKNLRIRRDKVKLLFVRIMIQMPLLPVQNHRYIQGKERFFHDKKILDIVVRIIKEIYDEN